MIMYHRWSRRFAPALWQRHRPWAPGSNTCDETRKAKCGGSGWRYMKQNEKCNNLQNIEISCRGLMFWHRTKALRAWLAWFLQEWLSPKSIQISNSGLDFGAAKDVSRCGEEHRGQQWCEDLHENPGKQSMNSLHCLHHSKSNHEIPGDFEKTQWRKPGFPQVISRLV